MSENSSLLRLRNTGSFVRNAEIGSCRLSGSCGQCGKGLSGTVGEEIDDACAPRYCTRPQLFRSASYLLKLSGMTPEATKALKR